MIWHCQLGCSYRGTIAMEIATGYQIAAGINDGSWVSIKFPDRTIRCNLQKSDCCDPWSQPSNITGDIITCSFDSSSWFSKTSANSEVRAYWRLALLSDREQPMTLHYNRFLTYITWSSAQSKYFHLSPVFSSNTKVVSSAGMEETDLSQRSFRCHFSSFLQFKHNLFAIFNSITVKNHNATWKLNIGVFQFLLNFSYFVSIEVEG